MQALCLLLASVVILATIQFSYTAAANRWINSVQGHREHRRGGRNRHDHPHESGHHGHDNKYNGARDDHDLSIHKDHILKPSHKNSDDLPSFKPYMPPYIESGHPPSGGLEAGHGLSGETRDANRLEADRPNIRVERVERPRKSLERRARLSMHRKYNHSPGRQKKPMNDLHKDQVKGNKHMKTKPMSHKAGKMDKKQSKKSRKECEGDGECKGGCCVPTKNGKKFCKKASVKPSGDKCASSCVCHSELRCFVGEYKRNGASKPHKDKKRILGRCINPGTADYNNGYFVDEIPMIE